MAPSGYYIGIGLEVESDDPSPAITEVFGALHGLGVHGVKITSLYLDAKCDTTTATRHHDNHGTSTHYNDHGCTPADYDGTLTYDDNSHIRPAILTRRGH